MADRRRPIAAATLALVAACSDGSPPPAPPEPALPASSSAAPIASAAAPPGAPAPAPAPRGSPVNPLGLPPSRLRLDQGRRVFTFSDRMLASARPGSTLVLYAATVVGFDGDDLIIEGRGGASYKVHPGYVIPVPDRPRVRLHEPVLTEWNGVMKHAVVARFVKDRIAVRFTDMEGRAPEALLKDVRLVPQSEGLAPGNYAALSDGDGWRHVLLVSRLGEGTPAQAQGPRDAARAASGTQGRWFALGYGGAAEIVAEASLKPIPISPRNLKVGASVWAQWVGALRPAVVQSIDDIGFYTVKFERAGRPVRLGWGHITPSLEGS